MTHEQALRMRAAIDVLIELTDSDRYSVAIKERLPQTVRFDADYAVHLFVRDKSKSGIIDLAILARAIENMGEQYHCTDSTYDAGTIKRKKIVNSVKIW